MTKGLKNFVFLLVGLFSISMLASCGSDDESEVEVQLISTI